MPSGLCTTMSLLNAMVDQTGAGQYSIQCTPTVRGRHELTVSVDGQQVAGSPFSVFVSIPPTQLSKPVKVWKNLTCAYWYNCEFCWRDPCF